MKKKLLLLLLLLVVPLLVMACEKAPTVTKGEVIDGEIVITYDNGETQTVGEVAEGNAPTVTKGEIVNGEIVITYSDGTTQNLGKAETEEEKEENDNPQGLEFLEISATAYSVRAGQALSREEIVIPATYRGKAVTQIARDGFANATNLKYIQIPASITWIGENAFSGCGKIEEVRLADLSAWCSVTLENGYSSPFAGTAKLVLNGSVLKNLTVPATVTEIGKWQFYGCVSLESFAFASGSTLTSIGKSSFSMCTSLKTAVLPTTLTALGEEAFSRCFALESINLQDTKLTQIKSAAFYGCRSLTMITIPQQIEWIESRAFANCSGLTVINYNATDAELYSDSFEGVGSSGAGVTLRVGANVTAIPDRMFYCSSSSIGTDNKLIAVVFADNSQCTEIGKSAFNRCTALTSVNFGTNSKLITIGDSAFDECAALTTVNFGANSKLSTIGQWAFSECTKLTSITIPATVTYISNYAFYGCTALSSVIFANTNGWLHNYNGSVTSGTSIAAADLRNPNTAATYLATTYTGHYWSRTVQ